MAGRRGMRRWSDDDLAVLRDRSLTASKVADQLGRSVSAVEQARIAYAENVPNPGKRRIRQQWSDADLVVALDRSLTMSEAAQQLGRTVGAVRSARALYSHGRIGESDRRRRWTEDDIEVLLDASLSTAEVARRLNRSVGTVYYAPPLRPVRCPLTRMERCWRGGSTAAPASRARNSVGNSGSAPWTHVRMRHVHGNSRSECRKSRARLQPVTVPPGLPRKQPSSATQASGLSMQLCNWAALRPPLRPPDGDS